MAGCSIEIRIATPGEMSQAVASMVAAFITDPIARFAWPSSHDHLHGMPLITREFAGGSFEHSAPPRPWPWAFGSTPTIGRYQ